MKNITLLLLLCSAITFAQQAYYDDVDLTLTGEDLYNELQDKIDQASSSYTYGDVRDTVKITDEDPDNSSNLLLVYGYNDTDGNCTTDRSRDKDDFGGMGCEYNREHVFARSLANPSMGNVDNGTTGIGADPHNLRPSDQQMNNNKASKKFAAGSGNAGNVGSGNWYPGDEWKGDTARMLMYMYTRYGDRCLPSLTGEGSLQGSTDMLQLFLQWNVEDPVSDFEDQRNPHLESVYGNRNPFIDNPYLATIIWGGPAAEDRWNLFSVEENESLSGLIYPNPATETFWYQTSTGDAPEMIRVFDLSGRVVKEFQPTSNSSYEVSDLKSGLYMVQLKKGAATEVHQLLIK